MGDKSGFLNIYFPFEDIKFSDGSDFDAEDVVFTYETVQKNQADNEYVDLTRLASVKEIDKNTVEFKLKEAYSPFLDTTALLQIVPSDAYKTNWNGSVQGCAI